MRSITDFINEASVNVEAIAQIEDWCKEFITGRVKINKRKLTIGGGGSKGLEINGPKLTKEGATELPDFIRFDRIDGDFTCQRWKTLKTCKNFPVYVGGSMYIDYCESLESLEGCPEEIGGGFYCSNCNSLESLEGAPQKIGEKVNYRFDCSDCKSLSSLEGAPSHIPGLFLCGGCKGKFTKDDVMEICDANEKLISC